MSLPQKNKYSGVSPNLAQQSRGPHTIQHRGSNPVQVPRTEDYRLQAFLQRSPGSGLSGGGAHDMSKPLGSQPPPPGTTLYVQQPQGGAPPPGQQGPPPQQCAPPQGQQGPPQGPPQHLAGTLQQGMAFYSRQAQQVQQGPPQQPNPQAAPQQVQGQCPPQQVGGNQGRGGGGLGRPPPMGLSAAPGGGGPPPPGSVGQAPANYQPSIINFAPSQAAYPTQHITPMGILNCMNIQAFPTQRTSQFNTTTAQYVYPHHQYIPQQHMPQPHQAVYYASPAIGPMPMVAPPQAQAPRGQLTSPQGSQPLQPRQKRVLAICDPNTGRSIFDDAETPPAESSPAATPEQQPSSSSTSDIPGTFAAQVAATLVDAPAPSKSPAAPAPPPPAAAVLEPPQTKSNERVAEWVAAAAAATTTAPSPAERQGSPPAEEERVAAPTAPEETAAVPAAEEKEEEVEVAPVAVEVGEVRNGEGRTPVVVEESARRAGDWEPERTATAAALEASREAADGRESKKSIKKKKMKEWNKKGENKEGGDMDAFVDREEPAAPASTASAASTPTEPTEAVPSAPLRTPSPTPLAAPQRASPSPQPAPEAAPAPAPTPVPVVPPVVVTPEQADPAAGEDEVHRKLVIIQNEENLRVSQEMAATEIVEKAEEPVLVSPSPRKEEEGEEEEGVEEEEEEEEEEESGDGGTPAQRLKYNYKEDQWSPLNPEGRKQYDRSFLIMLQGEPMSLKKPFGLPNLDVIKDTAMQHKLPEVQRPQYPPGGPPQMGGGGPMGGRGAHPEHLFMPPYARNGVARPPPGGGGGVGRRQSQPGRGGDKPKKVITLSSSLNQDVKLHAAQNAWKPTHKTPGEAAAEVAEAEELYRRVRGILNKLTPQKFQSLVEQVKNLQINSEERLNRVIDLVFEKALDEPNFSVPYANMCKQLAMFEVPMSSNESEKVNFRKLLLLKCQKEFEKDKGEDIRKAEQRKKIEEATTEEEKTKLREEMAEEEKRSKRRSLGNIRFIGELYNLNMLTAPIMYDCLRRLLNSNDEDSLECLCKLLITIGKELDATSATKGSQPGGKGGPPRSQLDDYFRTMDSIVKKREVSLRVVFMLQDVIDLRMRKWIPRRDENIPKTIDQIHEEAQREQVQEKLMRDVPLPKRDDRQDRRGGGKNRGGGGYDDGWNTVPSKKQHPDYNKSMDFNKVKQISTKMTEQDSIQLGPSARMSSWAKGSSGGGKMASQEPEGRSSGATNRFSALADVGSYDSRRGAQRSTASSRESSRGRGGSQQQQQQQGGSQSSLGIRKTPSQSRERDAALAAVKNLAAANAGPSPGPPSSSAQQHAPAPSPPEAASQEAAAPLAAPAGQGEARPREPDLVLRGSPTMDEDTLRMRTEALVDQFLCNSDFQDAVQNVVELASPSNVDVVVSTSINHILDRSPEARSLVGQLLKELLKKKLLSLDLFTKGLHSVLEYGEDMELDIPKVWEYAAELMAPLFQDHWLTLQYLRDAAQPLKAQGRAGRLAACVLVLLAKTLGEAAVAQLWRTAGLQWKDFLKPGEDVEAFAAANGVSFTLGGGGSGPATAVAPGTASPAPGAASAGVPAESVSSLTAAEVQAQLKYLVVSKGAPSAAIIEWIESNLGEAYARQPHFIRALITVIAENAITTLADGNAELKDELVKGYMDLLQKYLDHREELELQALYALQALVNRLQHPKGILVHLFNAFYDCDLISEDAFQQWAESPDPAEQEGKGVALKSTTSFFAWLGEMEGDSGEDN